jgi:hypothetical protein
MHDDKGQDSMNVERRVEPDSKRRAEDEVVISREPVFADARPIDDQEMPNRRRSERRKIDRMATGI